MTAPHRRLAQAAALAFELHMHIEDLLDDDQESSEAGVPLVSEDTDQEVGRMVDIKPGHNDATFRVTTADGTVLFVTVEVEE